MTVFVTAGVNDGATVGDGLGVEVEVRVGLFVGAGVTDGLSVAVIVGASVDTKVDVAPKSGKALLLQAVSKLKAKLTISKRLINIRL